MDVLLDRYAARNWGLSFEVGSKVEGGSIEEALIVKVIVHGVEVLNSDVLLVLLVLGGLPSLFRNLRRLSCESFVVHMTLNGLMRAFRVFILFDFFFFCRFCFLLTLGGSVEDPHVIAVRHLLQRQLALRDFCGVQAGLRCRFEDRLHVVVWFTSVHYFVNSPCLSVYFVDCLGGRVIDVCSDGGLAYVQTLFVDQVDQYPALLSGD